MRRVAILVGLVALSLTGAARAESVPPPPPIVLPQDAPLAPPPPPPAKLPHPEPNAPVVLQTHLSGAARGALAGAAGATVGAGAGAALLFWGALAQEVPDIAFLVVGAAIPALAAFFGGSSVLAFVVDSPTADDWGSVAACTALGCLAVGVAVLGGAGGLSIGTGCGTCGDPFGRSETDRRHIAMWGTAGSGVGSAVGLAVGALTGFVLVAGDPSVSVNGPATIAVSAGVGSIVGAAAGGAIGGGIGGSLRDESASLRERAPRRLHTRSRTDVSQSSSIHR